VLNYIAKVLLQGRKESQSYRDLVREILPRIANRNPVVSFAAKLMYKLISELDWSAQEVCHVLMKPSLQEGSRVVRAMDCRPYNRQHAAMGRPDQLVVSVRSQYEKYLERTPDRESITYLNFLLNIDFCRGPQNWRRVSRAKPRVLNCLLEVSSHGIRCSSILCPT
jgi:hypothetical protein